MTTEKKIKITWDDLQNVVDLDPVPSQTQENKTWGTVSSNPNIADLASPSRGSLFLKGWFYLGAAGLTGAFLAWMFCEPSFGDGLNDQGWGNILIAKIVAILMCVCLGTVESIVERSWKRGLLRGLASLGLGLILGVIFDFMADIVYNILQRLLINMGEVAESITSNPLHWVFRGLAWALFGIAGGLIFGIVSKSGKKISYGMLGGVIGGFIGGFLFDPILLMTKGAEASRAIGFSILGASTGISIGLVESALKERWLYVSNGPLAGKQFILYQDVVTIGKDQSSTVYLFKDPSILDQHATIVRRAGKTLINAFGPVVISGQVYQDQKQKVLCSGDVLKIGRYTFTYAEKN